MAPPFRDEGDGGTGRPPRRGAATGAGVATVAAAAHAGDTTPPPTRRGGLAGVGGRAGPHTRQTPLFFVAPTFYSSTNLVFSVSLKTDRKVFKNIRPYRITMSEKAVKNNTFYKSLEEYRGIQNHKFSSYTSSFKRQMMNTLVGEVKTIAAKPSAYAHYQVAV